LFTSFFETLVVPFFEEAEVEAVFADF